MSASSHSQAPDATAKGPLSERSDKARRRRSLRQDAFNLPNILTMLRIAIIPLVLVFLERGSPRDCFIAAVFYSIAAITDFVDGWLARRQNLVSVLGKFLDPLADKLAVMAVAVWLVTLGRIPAWIVVLILAREITVTALRAIASNEGLVIAAGREGKSKTGLQMVGIICMLLGHPYHLNLWVYDFGMVDMLHIGRALIYLSLIFSLASAYQYVRLFVDAVDAKDRRQASDSPGDKQPSANVPVPSNKA